jgi:hypothetical protein
MLDERVKRGAVTVDLLTSTEVQSVRASIDTVTVELLGAVAEPGVLEWYGIVGLASLPEGLHELVIMLANADGSTSSVRRSINYDAQPILTITAPVAGATANPLIAIDAACADKPDRCRSMVVVYRQSASIDRNAPIDAGRLIACDPERIAGSFDLSRFAGTSGWLDFYASDRGTDESLRELVKSVPITVGGTANSCGVDTDAGPCASASPAPPAVTAPVGGPVARPNVTLAASCADAPGAPCRGVYVWYWRNDLLQSAPRYKDLVACVATTDQLTSNDFAKLSPVTDGTYVLYEGRQPTGSAPRHFNCAPVSPGAATDTAHGASLSGAALAFSSFRACEGVAPTRGATARRRQTVCTLAAEHSGAKDTGRDHETLDVERTLDHRADSMVCHWHGIRAG